MSSQQARSKGMPKRSAAPPPKPSRTPWIIGIAAVVIVVAAVVAILVGGGGSGGTGVAEPARSPVGVAGSALPALSNPASDAAVGQPIPTLTGTDITGAAISIGPEDGATAIVILAHWCPHCQAEVPLLVDYLNDTGMPDGVRLVAISTSITPTAANYPPSAWLEREGWTAPTLNDDANSTALHALGMSNFPGFVFVDADGRVAGRMTGEIPMDTFDELVNSLAP
jgi:hypothetical protein